MTDLGAVFVLQVLIGVAIDVVVNVNVVPIGVVVVVDVVPIGVVDVEVVD